MTIPPLWRQITIGIIVAACFGIGTAALLWTKPVPVKSLADRLPAKAVLAYIDSQDLLETLTLLAPSLSVPEVDPDVSVLAAVRGPDGTEGWISYAVTNGHVRIHGSNPSLAELLSDEQSSPLSADPTFRTLTRDHHHAFAYITYPLIPSEESPFASLLTLESPVLAVANGSGLSLRTPLSPTPRLDVLSMESIIDMPGAHTTFTIPSWRSMEALSMLMTDDADLIAKTLATTFADSIAPGISLEHDLRALLDGPFHVNIGESAEGATTYSIEGTAHSPMDAETALRIVHERFSAARGRAIVKTSQAEGFTIRTMMIDEPDGTNERMENGWSILETTVDGEHLASAQNGRRFAVTNVPSGLRTSSAVLHREPLGMSIDPVRANAVLGHLLPALPAKGNDLAVELTGGPGYVEWTIYGIGAR